MTTIQEKRRAIHFEKVAAIRIKHGLPEYTVTCKECGKGGVDTSKTVYCEDCHNAYKNKWTVSFGQLNNALQQ